MFPCSGTCSELLIPHEHVRDHVPVLMINHWKFRRRDGKERRRMSGETPLGESPTHMKKAVLLPSFPIIRNYLFIVT